MLGLFFDFSLKYIDFQNQFVTDVFLIIEYDFVLPLYLKNPFFKAQFLHFSTSK